MKQGRPKLRDVNGILLLDKPTGITSNAALQKVKRCYAAQKAGHTGSLDPLASGMLPLCFGEATKFSQFLLEADKVYRVIAKLGIKTATGDAEGEIIQQRDVPVLDEPTILAVLREFQGPIEQIPSMYSAIKHQGQPLYKLARQGIEIERKSRLVQIFKMDLLARDADTFTVEVHCSKGTYIRTLVEDIGERLGCGAHVIGLKRLTVGPYAADRMVSLAALEELAQRQDYKTLDSYLLPLDTTVANWQEVRLSEATAYYLRQGQPVIVPYAPAAGWVRLVANNGRFLGVGEIIDDGRVAPRRLLAQ